MIVNHKHKFIFLKVSKAAGSSVEAFLRQFCHPGDIVTPLIRQEERAIRSLGFCPPTGYKKILRPASAMDRIKIALGQRRAIKKCCVYAHSPAADVKAYVGDDIWNSYFKFCILRHPIDRVLSQYFWISARKGWKDSVSDFDNRFDEFSSSKYFETLKNKNYGIITIDDKVAVDHIVNFHSLEQSISHVLEHLKISHDKVELPRFKSVQRPRGDFQNRLTAKQRNLIMQTFELDASLLASSNANIA